MDADKLELLIQRMSRADKLRATDRRAADQIAARKRLGEYDPNSAINRQFINNLIMSAIEMGESDGFVEGGEVKKSRLHPCNFRKRSFTQRRSIYNRLHNGQHKKDAKMET